MNVTYKPKCFPSQMHRNSLFIHDREPELTRCRVCIAVGWNSSCKWTGLRKTVTQRSDWHTLCLIIKRLGWEKEVLGFCLTFYWFRRPAKSRFNFSHSCVTCSRKLEEHSVALNLTRTQIHFEECRFLFFFESDKTHVIFFQVGLVPSQKVTRFTTRLLLKSLLCPWG